MRNVILFPKAVTTAPARKAMTGAKTLFVHVKRTTMIVHLAGMHAAMAPGTQIEKHS